MVEYGSSVPQIWNGSGHPASEFDTSTDFCGDQKASWFTQKDLTLPYG